MSDSLLRYHLRAALNAAIATEQEELRAKADDAAQFLAKRVELMRPFIAAFRVLQREVGWSNGAEFVVSSANDFVKLSLEDWPTRNFMVTTEMDSPSYEVRVESSVSDKYMPKFEAIHSRLSAEQALAVLVEAVGKHIARRSQG